MRKLQKIWAWFVLIFAVVHYIRDTLQDLGVQNILTTTLVKSGHSMVLKENSLSFYKIYWAIFNTYTIEVSAIILTIICLRRNRFGFAGKMTVGIAIAVIFLWSFSWFFLK